MRSVFVTSAVLLSSTLLFLPAGQAQASQGPSGSASQPAGQGGVHGQEAEHAIAAAATNAEWAGLVLATDGTVDVYLTAADQQLQQDIVGSYPASDFTFETTSHSLGQLVALEGQVAKDIPSWNAVGLQILEVYPDLASNLLAIGVEQPSPTATQELQARYGASNIEVVQGQVGTPASSRVYDSPPWNGGDWISAQSNGTGEFCTSGPPMVNLSNGHTYLLTAGHCFGLQTIYNGAAYVRGGTLPTIGFVSSRDYTNNDPDYELIYTGSQGGSSTLDWRGSSTSTTSAAQEYAASPYVGESVCASGAPEGEVCGTVIRYQGCLTYTDHTVHCDLWRADNSNQFIIGQGDSGGPVYAVDSSNGKLEIAGINNAEGQSTYCPGPYQTNPPSRLCSHTAFFTDIVTLEDTSNLTLKIS